MDSYPVFGFLADHLSFTFLAVSLYGPTMLIITLITLLVLSFIISGAEVAFFSLEKKELNMLKTKQHHSAKRIINLLEEPKEVYASLLIAGTFINISIIVLSNLLINRYFSFGKLGGLGEIVSKVFLIAFVLIFLVKFCPRFGLPKTTSGLPMVVPLLLNHYISCYGGSVNGLFH